jgi:hypothetical protein
LGIFDPIFIGIYAAKVSNRLIDLGIDVIRLEKAEPELKDLLYEIEKEKRKEMTPYEAASHFFAPPFHAFHLVAIYCRFRSKIWLGELGMSCCNGPMKER